MIDIPAAAAVVDLINDLLGMDCFFISVVVSCCAIKVILFKAKKSLKLNYN
jgi:hypothetical protein